MFASPEELLARVGLLQYSQEQYALAKDLLDMAYSYICSITGRKFINNDYTERIKIEDGVIFLKETPVNEITSIYTISDNDQLGTELSVKISLQEKGIIYLTEAYTGYVEVHYNAGYIQSDPEYRMLQRLEIEFAICMWKAGGAVNIYADEYVAKVFDIPELQERWNYLRNILDAYVRRT